MAFPNIISKLLSAKQKADDAWDDSQTRAIKNHASDSTEYGVGGTLYGHVKLSDATNGTSGVSGGIAATPAAVKAAYTAASNAMPKSGGTFTGPVIFNSNAKATFNNSSVEFTDTTTNKTKPVVFNANAVFKSSGNGIFDLSGETVTKDTLVGYPLIIRGKDAAGTVVDAHPFWLIPTDTVGNTGQSFGLFGAQGLVVGAGEGARYYAGYANVTKYEHLHLVADNDISFVSNANTVTSTSSNIESVKKMTFTNGGNLFLPNGSTVKTSDGVNDITFAGNAATATLANKATYDTKGQEITDYMRTIAMCTSGSNVGKLLVTNGKGTQSVVALPFYVQETVEAANVYNASLTVSAKTKGGSTASGKPIKVIGVDSGSVPGFCFGGNGIAMLAGGGAASEFASGASLSGNGGQAYVVAARNAGICTNLANGYANRHMFNFSSEGNLYVDRITGSSSSGPTIGAGSVFAARIKHIADYNAGVRPGKEHSMWIEQTNGGGTFGHAWIKLWCDKGTSANGSSGIDFHLRTPKTATDSSDKTDVRGVDLIMTANTATSATISFRPINDNIVTLGDISGDKHRWKEVFSAQSSINTSDARLKTPIETIPDNVLDAWGEVSWGQFKFLDAVKEKGSENARIHTGLIAQRIKKIFERHGLDAADYGLFCYNKWDAQPEVLDDDGKVQSVAVEAGDLYSLRYAEALAMEAAYQRRRADRLEDRVAKLEALISGAK